MRFFQFLALASLALYALPTHAGGSSDGTETVNYRAVEEYEIEDFTKMKGYGLFKEKMDLLVETFPLLGKRLKEQMEKKSWYLIPKKFKTLETEQAKFNFTIETPAYQNDKQVFFSEVSQAEMTEKSAAVSLMHEALMTLQDPRDSQSVAIVTGRILAKNSSPQQIQEALAENHFGLYFTKPQMALQRKNVQFQYAQFLKKRIGEAEGDCFPRADVERRMMAVAKTRAELLKFRFDEVRGDLNSGRGMLNSGKEWASPFTGEVTSGGLYVATVSGVERASPERWAAFNSASAPHGFSKRFQEAINVLYILGAKLNARELQSLRDNSDHLNATKESDYLKIRDLIARDPAFVDLLAIQVKLLDGGEDLRDLPYYSEEQKHWRPVLELAKAKLNSVPKNKIAQLDRICKNVAALFPLVKKIHDELDPSPEPVSPPSSQEECGPYRANDTLSNPASCRRQSGAAEAE